MVILKPNHFYDITQYTILLPKNYNFELQKTITFIHKHKINSAALQLPDGLLKYSPIIIDCLKHFTSLNKIIILGDVLYGACNMDDQLAYDLGCEAIIHYGHSCIIPIRDAKIKVLYVFVGIGFDIEHCVEMIKKVARKEMENNTFGIESTGNVGESIKTNSKFKQIEDKEVSRNKLGMKNSEEIVGSGSIKIFEDPVLLFIKENIELVGTIQFNASLHQIANVLSISVPQIKPLSRGEILGCTSPRIYKPLVIYIADGRFHLESAMIQNPSCKFYKYCPFAKTMSLEFYDYAKMLKYRKESKMLAFKGKKVGVIRSRLGRQGNIKIVDNVIKYLENIMEKVYRIDLCEINNQILQMYDLDFFVQIGCPRLSIDWGNSYGKPLLNAYEVFNDLDAYEMDYYSRENKKPWNNNTE